MPLYHYDIYIPATLARPHTDKPLCYTVHAICEAHRDQIDRILPHTVPPVHQLVEVETIETSCGDVVSKWVVRYPHPFRKAHDIVLVIMSDYTVKTVWVNHRDDYHSTLDRSRYAPLSQETQS